MLLIESIFEKFYWFINAENAVCLTLRIKCEKSCKQERERHRISISLSLLHWGLQCNFWFWMIRTALSNCVTSLYRSKNTQIHEYDSIRLCLSYHFMTCFFKDRIFICCWIMKVNQCFVVSYILYKYQI